VVAVFRPGKIRKRLTYANVMSSIAVFLVLGGATAFAASHLGKNSVGSKQLKSNAVTSAKIKKNAITTAKIKNGAVTGAKIKAASVPFSQAVARLHVAGPVAPGPLTIVSLGSYTQPAGEDDQYIGGVEVTFGSGCAAPRDALAYLIEDPANPANPQEEEVAGTAIAFDSTGATATHRANFLSGYLGPVEGRSLLSYAPLANETHSFYLYLPEADCSTGTGSTVSNMALDVIGTK
jgi:hypothetical protein